MRLSLQTFSSLVENMAASVQSSPARLVDLTVGSALRAVLEAGASAGLWMQWLIVQVLQTTRAATSSGADLDTWTADFSFARLPARPSSGVVTFARYTPAAAAAIPLGALVRTSDASQTFAVVGSPGVPGFVASANGYVIGAGASSIDVPVVAQASGAAGNVLGGTVTLIATAMQGIDTVTNAAGFANGMDAESDAAVRMRFQSFIDTRSRATSGAVSFAIASVQQGLSWSLQENVDPAGAPRVGNFVVTVDDGSGAPSSSLLSSVTAAIDAVRPVGSTFSVQPPAVLRADVSLSLAVGSGRASPAAAGSVAQAVTAYIAALPLGASLSVSKMAHVAYNASSVVTNVYDVTIDGAASDLAASVSSVIRPGTIAVG